MKCKYYLCINDFLSNLIICTLFLLTLSSLLLYGELEVYLISNLSSLWIYESWMIL